MTQAAQITKVYKGDLKEGDRISLAEKYYTIVENGETTRHELGCAPLTPEKEYIFFLIKAQDDNEFLRGFYSPMVKETGRYPVIETKDSAYPHINLLSASDLNLVQEKPDTYKKIYQQVIEKYMQ